MWPLLAARATNGAHQSLVSKMKEIEIQRNHTHVKKVGHTSEFLFSIYWWTWKTNNY